MPLRVLTYFNPRSPRGERLYRTMQTLPLVLFQSTLPAGGATRPGIQRRERRKISIHAPRGGSDSRCYQRTFLFSVTFSKSGYLVPSESPGSSVFKVHEGYQSLQIVANLPGNPCPLQVRTVQPAGICSNIGAISSSSQHILLVSSVNNYPIHGSPIGSHYCIRSRISVPWVLHHQYPIRRISPLCADVFDPMMETVAQMIKT